MTTDTATVLRGAGRADLLAAAPILLGFHPCESLVLLGISEARVEFCLRADLEQFPLVEPEIVEQADNAAAGLRCCVMAVLAYSQCPAAPSGSARRVARALRAPVVEVLVTDGQRYWSAVGDGPDEGAPFHFEQCSLSAQAVYEGLSVAASRDQAVAAVAAPGPELTEQLEAALGDALDVAALLPDDERMVRVRELVEAADPLSAEEATELAALVCGEDVVGELLAQLNTGNAGVARARLAQARARCSTAGAPNVLAVLAVACWLDSQGAMTNECLTQLAEAAPGHPVLGLLVRLHQLAIPPRRWDEA